MIPEEVIAEGWRRVELKYRNTPLRDESQDIAQEAALYAMRYASTHHEYSGKNFPFLMLNVARSLYINVQRRRRLPSDAIWQKETPVRLIPTVAVAAGFDVLVEQQDLIGKFPLSEKHRACMERWLEDPPDNIKRSESEKVPSRHKDQTIMWYIVRKCRAYLASVGALLLLIGCQREYRPTREQTRGCLAWAKKRAEADAEFKAMTTSFIPCLTFPERCTQAQFDAYLRLGTRITYLHDNNPCPVEEFHPAR